jgi:lysophospholipase L1-like esterase
VVVRLFAGGDVRWRSFVAVGDSFTEGLDDPSPRGDGYRGWADLVATRLADTEPGGRVPAGAGAGAGAAVGFSYANLAVRGRLFDAIVADQVPAALAMKPDLISFAGGGNDVLRRSVDLDVLLSRFADVVGGLRATGADVILFRFADVTRRLPGKKMIRPRVHILNQAVGEVAERHGAMLIDLWHDEEFANPGLWSVDRLHLSAAGHRRVAGHVLTALGVPVDPAWMMSPALPERRGWVAQRAHDAVWVGRYLAPWVKRRLTGRSSGDFVQAKRPTLSRVTD